MKSQTPALHCTMPHSLSRTGLDTGDVTILDGNWYVTHAGLLRLAAKRRCVGIQTQAVTRFCDMNARRWTFRATVYTSRSCKGFAGYGDADPSNISELVRGAEMRVAETRAVNRALRKAYGIGICSVDEISSTAAQPERAPFETKRASRRMLHLPSNGDGQPRLRDRLRQLIRQHELDPILVKSYAIDFCGTKTLHEATREQIENFIDHLAHRVTADRHALVTELNSYLQPQERAS